MKVKITITILFLLSLFFLFYFKDYFLIQSEVLNKVSSPKSSVGVTELVVSGLSQLKDYTGAQVNTESMAGLLKSEDTIRVFHFWASWCDPCLNEIPDFIEFARGKVASQAKAQFFLVSLDYEQKDLLKFTKIFPALLSRDFIQLWDKENFLSKGFVIDKLPMTVITYPNNQVSVYNGVVPWKNFEFASSSSK